MASIIGEKYTVRITRPIGSVYPSNEEIKYSVHYGEVVDVIDAYDEPQEAYVLGIEEPVKEFNGRLIAIIHRLNDVKNNWVVANKAYTKEEIYEKVKFVEQYFKVEILM